MRWGAGAVSGDMTRTAVLALLAREGPLSRAEIAGRLELSPATVTTITRKLLGDGLVTEGGPRAPQTGRPSIPLALVPGAAYAIGVQVAYEHITLVLSRLDATMVHAVTHHFDPTESESLGRLTDLIRTEVEYAIANELPLLGVGVAVPGVVDPETGTLRMSMRLGWTGMPLAALLRDAFDLPVLVDNDISALTAADRLYGPGADCSDFLLVAIGQGIGLGMVLDGAPYRGAAGAAGELGHFPVLPDGPLCGCGNRGCLETQVSTVALVNRARERGAVALDDDLSDLLTAADAGRPEVVSLLAEVGDLLGRVLAGSVNLLGPQAVVIVGEITPLWPHLAVSFHRALAAHLIPGARQVRVDVRAWEQHLIAQGAAGIVLAAPLAVPRQRS
jgi:predicted NBD/HSP70 family sugar kinase